MPKHWHQLANSVNFKELSAMEVETAPPPIDEKPIESTSGLKTDQPAQEERKKVDRLAAGRLFFVRQALPQIVFKRMGPTTNLLIARIWQVFCRGADCFNLAMGCETPFMPVKCIKVEACFDAAMQTAKASRAFDHRRARDGQRRHRFKTSED